MRVPEKFIKICSALLVVPLFFVIVAVLSPENPEDIEDGVSYVPYEVLDEDGLDEDGTDDGDEGGGDSSDGTSDQSSTCSTCGSSSLSSGGDDSDDGSGGGSEDPGSQPPPSSPNLSVIINAGFHGEVEDLLVYGDRVYAVAIRDGPETPVTQAKVTAAINSLNSVDQSGISKSIVFSSVADLNTYLSQVPPTVNWISYNMEGSMTPVAERNNVVNSVASFASAVHATGRKVAWGPIVSLFDTMEAAGKLDDVIMQIDAVGYQGQNILANGGVDYFSQQVQAKNALFKGYNSGVKMQVQLVVGNNTVAEIIEAFGQVDSYIDYGVIFSSGGASGVEDVLEGMR